MASKWVPWEVGVADQIKGEESILVVPVADDYGQFDGSEYFQLYRRVVPAEVGGYGVFQPAQTSGILLENHLRKFAQVA